MNNTVSSVPGLNATAEAILMGMTQRVDNMEDAEYVINYLLNVLKVQGHPVPTAQEVIKESLKYSPDKTIAYIGVSTLMGEFLVLNIVLKGKKSKNCNVTSENGVLAYCYNITAPDCSELGYMFFEKTLKGLRRIA